MIKAAILKNEDPFDHEPWIIACEKRKDSLIYEIIDLSIEDWFEKIDSLKPDILLTKPAGKTALFREQYMERFGILNDKFKLPSIPSFNEALIYENKRYFSYWLKSNKIPHPKTLVFYTKKEAFEFAEKTNYPIVAKINIGASGNGVSILNNKNQMHDYINKAFFIGVSSFAAPKLSKGKILKRIWVKVTNPQQLKNRLKSYRDISNDKQIGFVILQEYIEHNFEWRAVRIGDSFFAHKKLKLGEKASGSLVKRYENPPLKIFDFVENITSPFNFTSMAVDFFETSSGEFLVNEMQCIFGQSDPYQMLVDGKMGRYRKLNNEWVFEEGNFAKDQCYDLRLEYIIQKYNENPLH